MAGNSGGTEIILEESVSGTNNKILDLLESKKAMLITLGKQQGLGNTQLRFLELDCDKRQNHELAENKQTNICMHVILQNVSEAT